MSALQFVEVERIVAAQRAVQSSLLERRPVVLEQKLAAHVALRQCCRRTRNVGSKQASRRPQTTPPLELL